MYRQRLSNPYEGLSDGIQNGLATLADSQVKLAQIQNDRQIRDRDYQQRLQEFNADQAYKGETLKLNQAAEARAADKYNNEQVDAARKEWSGLMAEIQGADGSMDPTQYENKKRFVARRMMDLVTRYPHLKEKVGSYIKSRTGWADSVELKHVPGYGDVMEIYDSKDPAARRGVLTDNASKDPNDPVSKFSPDDIISLSAMVGNFAYDGAAPSATEYLLNPVEFDPTVESGVPSGVPSGGKAEGSSGTSSQGNGNSHSRPLIATLPAQTDIAPSAPAEAPYVYQDPAKVRKQSGVLASLGAIARNNVEAGKAFGKGIVTDIADTAGATVDGVSNAATRIGDSLATGWNGPAAEPAYDGVTGVGANAKGGIAVEQPRQEAGQGGADQSAATRRTPEDAAAYDQLPSDVESLVQAKIKHNAGVQRAAEKALKGVQVSNKAMGRFLAVSIANGSMTPAQAVGYANGATDRAEDLFKMAIETPNEADIRLALITRGGAGKTPESEKLYKVYEHNNKTINGMIDFVNKGEKEGTYKVPPSAAQGVKDAFYTLGFRDPESFRLALAKHGPQIQQALDSFPAIWAEQKKNGRTPEGVLAEQIHSVIRRTGTPMDEDQQSAYRSFRMDLMERSKSGSDYILLDPKLKFYDNLVQSTGQAEISMEDFDKLWQAEIDSKK